METYQESFPQPTLPIAFATTEPVRFRGQDGRPYVNFHKEPYSQATLTTSGSIASVNEVYQFIKTNRGKVIQFLHPPLNSMTVTIIGEPQMTYVTGAYSVLTFSISAI